MQNNNSAFLQPSPAFSSQNFLTPESRASLSLTNFDSAEGDDSVYYTVNNSDYSTTLEDILSEDGDEGGNRTHAEFEEDDDDEGFLYTGVDAVDAGGYKAQLKDLLGEDAEADSEAEVEESYSLSLERQVDEGDEEEFSYDKERESFDSPLPNEQSESSLVIPSITLSPSPTKPVKRRPFVHPSVSRLRSITPQRMMPETPDTSVMSPAVSNLSSLSRRSSILSEFAHTNVEKSLPKEAFKWSPLKIINSLVFSMNRNNADAGEHGEPTVIATNGLICIGTRKGRVLVFEFKQKMKCVCGASPSAQEQGAVTAVALSQDHTFVAAGHASGHIFLYNLEKPDAPVRSVPTTDLTAVASGRKEGHLANARISRIGFVGKRHTGIVSSDENGLAFYHSLGKVLFIEANDVLRVLGKYPSRDTNPLSSRKQTTILAMSPLPLGGVQDPVDEYNLTALLTPVKLVIVGLNPSPRTWFRQHRHDTHDTPPLEDSLWRGCLAWQPVIKSSEPEDAPEKNGKDPKKLKNIRRKSKARPLLVYSWGKECHVLAVREEVTTAMVTHPKTGKLTPVSNGKVLFEEQVRWSSSRDLIALQWLSGSFVLGITVSHTVQVWDIGSGSLVESSSLGSLLTSWSPAGEELTKPLQSGDDFGQSLKTYKDKVFLLHRNRLVVGSLLHWTDRILAYVQEGDFLSAIDLTRAYLLDEAPGNQLGLPDDSTSRRQLLGLKLKELMTASITYSFSEERLTDQTHVTFDGRGVDRTSLFENLVGSCARSCIELDDLDLLYEELFERYTDWGITSIFLVQLEPFILENQITYVPPRITQQLIARHVMKGDLAAAERLIWHIDPQCLDIDQAITLCKQHDLWDALIYVYCAALQDFVSPIVEILGLIRWILQLSKKIQLGIPFDPHDEDRMERLTPVSYKLFPYLSSVLSGLRYPSQLPMESMEAHEAKEEICAFLFSGRSAVWPKGESGELVATVEEGDAEPTYPYLRLLLRYDAEAFLNSLDIAFEDSFLNEGFGHVNRLLIVKILLDVQESTDLQPGDITLINIFIARNVPKYPQYLGLMPPSTLQMILLSLIEDSESDTLEERQLAAEFLLSAFKPHRTDELEAKMRNARFYRILRNWYQQDRKWPELLAAYVDDSSLLPSVLIEDVDSVLRRAKSSEQLRSVLLQALPQLADNCLLETASLVDRHIPELHAHLLSCISDDHPALQLAYLEHLIQGDGSEPPAPHLAQELREKYLSLLCRLQRGKVISALKHSFPPDSDWNSLEDICLSSENYSAAVWCVYTQNRLKDTFSKWEALNQDLSQVLLQQLGVPESDMAFGDVASSLESLKQLQEVALEICEAQSDPQPKSVDIPVEDMWLSILAAQINIVQRVSSQRISCPTEHWNNTLKVLRNFVEETLSARMRVGSSDPAEFPNLFKRLVDATASTRSNSESSYSEFRLILGEMLGSYRSEGDLLESVNVLSGKDLLETMKQLSKARNRGWRPKEQRCETCNSSLAKQHHFTLGERNRLIISRTGAIYHKDCFTPE